MRKYAILISLVSLPLFADVDSSIDIPYGKHQKYTLGNQKNHPTIKFEGERYFYSLAKISKNDVSEIVAKESLSATAISLTDLRQELVYEVYAKDDGGKKYKLYVDAGNGKILQKQGN